MQAIMETAFDAIYLTFVTIIGVMMIPKTLAYVGTVVIGYRAMRHDVA